MTIETTTATDETRASRNWRTRAGGAESTEGSAALLDDVWTLTTTHETRVVVFASASTSDADALVVEGLVQEADRRGLSTLRVALVRGGVLVQHAGEGALTIAPDRLSSIDLHAWVHRVAPGTELVIITAPSLATSLDAALLAGVCDGLVIVAESGVTASGALEVAAERARITGCRILGVVMRTARRRLPDWISRLMRTERAGADATPPPLRSWCTPSDLP
ncbi:MAG: hypothetical protein ABIR79_24065 [Candidatus Binatia bacterium]